jgi:hypothetical protein
MAYPPFEKALINLSSANTFEEAVKEWDFVRAYRESDQHCICGQEIVNVTEYRNMITGNLAKIGCNCVESMVGEDLPFDFSIYSALSGKRPLRLTDVKTLREMELIKDSDFDSSSIELIPNSKDEYRFKGSQVGFNLELYSVLRIFARRNKLSIEKPPIRTVTEREALLMRLYKREILNEWETNFLADVWAYDRCFSQKQHSIRDRILRKVWDTLGCEWGRSLAC